MNFLNVAYCTLDHLHLKHTNGTTSEVRRPLSLSQQRSPSIVLQWGIWRL